MRGRRRGEKEREWWDQGRRGTEGKRGRMRKPFNTLIKWFLVELWKMNWKSSRIVMERIIGRSLRDDIVLDEMVMEI